MKTERGRGEDRKQRHVRKDSRKKKKKKKCDKERKVCFGRKRLKLEQKAGKRRKMSVKERKLLEESSRSQLSYRWTHYKCNLQPLQTTANLNLTSNNELQHNM